MTPDERNRYIAFARHCAGNRVYPLSIAEGIQRGDIFADDEKNMRSVLFWHQCGFAYLSGQAEEPFLQTIYERFYQKRTERRFALITDDPHVIGFFAGRDGVVPDKRAEYRFDRETAQPGSCAYRIERISSANIGGVRGRIVPGAFWASDEEFLAKGFGYAALDNDRVAAVAFSAAVSSDEVDIGIETAEPYRRRGLAKTLAAAMCREILSMGKQPVWAHSVSNVGSMRTAVGAGFAEDRINTVIKQA